MADIMFRGVFCTARIADLEQATLNVIGVVVCFDDIILMKDMAEKMAVIQFGGQRVFYIVRQGFEPVTVVAAQGDI